MRQSRLNFFFITLSLALLFGCATTAIDEFAKIKEGMTKDEVLELVGSPLRTERFDGKEKWAYRYWAGDDKDVELLRQVTFLNGKVISEGEDKAEMERIKEINQTDAQRAESRRAAKAAAPASAADLAAPATASGANGAAASVTDPEKELRDHVQQFIPNESDFVEVKGVRSAPKATDDADKGE